MSAKRVGKKGTAQPEPQVPRVYTLEVFVIGGPVTEKFAKRNPVISRTIKIRGDQTLEDLHHATFGAFGRWNWRPHIRERAIRPGC